MNTDVTYHFNGKVALVTGAASGIGLATAIDWGDHHVRGIAFAVPPRRVTSCVCPQIHFRLPECSARH